MLGQLATLIQFRLLMLRRIWFRTAAGQMAAVTALFVALLLLFIGSAIAVGLFFLGWQFLPSADPVVTLLVTDGIVLLVLMVWAAGVLTELQRSDVLDFRRMLYLPVSLPMVFLLNFVASLVTPILPIFVLGALGLTLGLTLGAGARMLVVLPLAAAFFLMLAAWTYHFRGWLGVLMENKRRRRFILTVIPLFFIILSQLPNILTHTFSNRYVGNHEKPDYDSAETAEELEAMVRSESEAYKRESDSAARGVTTINAALPPAWLALGVKAAQERDYGVVSMCLAGMTALGGLGLAAGYRATYRHYVAATRKRARSQGKPRQAPTGRMREPLTARRISGLADDTAAVAFASWLTAIRHPGVRMQLVMPFIFGLIFMLPVIMRKGDAAMPLQGQPMVGVVLFMILAGFAVFLFNQFGTDPEGFQALVLLPTPRKRYLMGKNLAFLPIVTSLFVIFAGLASVLTRPPAFLVGLVTLQFFQIYLSLCIVGNFMSILFPFRMRKDSMNAAGAKPAAFLASILAIFGVPILMIPTGLAMLVHVVGRDLPGFEHIPLGLIVSAIFLLGTAILYAAMLGPAGRLLQSREQRILATLQKDRE